MPTHRTLKPRHHHAPGVQAIQRHFSDRGLDLAIAQAGDLTSPAANETAKAPTPRHQGGHRASAAFDDDGAAYPVALQARLQRPHLQAAQQQQAE